MQADFEFRKNSYLGEVVYVDMVSKDIIAKGHGEFNVHDMTMNVSVTAFTGGHYRRIIVVLKTNEGYVAPFVVYSQTLLLGLPIDTRYSMEAYLRWPIDMDVQTVTQAFQCIDIYIKARHSTDKVSSVIHKKGITAQFSTKATAAQICYGSWHGIKIRILAGFVLRRNSYKARSDHEAGLRSYIRYCVEHEDRKGSFRMGDIGRVLLAFKLYWISYHDSIDCTITAIKLGDHVTLTLAENVLRATSTATPDFRTNLAIQQQHYVETLARMAHFFINPQRKKTLSASSKVGLAFVRLIDHRFRQKRKILDIDIASLIFALQSLTESIAMGEIRRQNRAAAQATKVGIDKVLASVIALENTLPKAVADFYIRPRDEIYRNIAKPTFMRSLKVSLDKLGIDITPHHQMLRAIDKARRQVVHSEGYSAEFLLNLIAHSTVKSRVGDDSLVRSIVVKQKTSEIDKLYALLREMVRKYFEQYDL